MQLYIYAKSGHSIGLEATRRCAAIANKLKEFDPILATCDFRAGAYAKSELGVKKYVNVDVLTNLPNLMSRGDILIFESNESTDFMESHMKEFCTHLYKIGNEITTPLYDDSLFFKNETPKYEESFFFGDDDYENRVLALVKDIEKTSFNLLWGHYFFLGNEKVLGEKFENIFEDEEYVDLISNSKFLLTASLQAAIESIACGNKPVLLLREDKEYNEMLIKELNLPTIAYETNFDLIIKNFKDLKNNYPKLNEVKNFDFHSIYTQIKGSIETFKKVQG